MGIRVIIALDFNTEKEARSLISRLDPSECALKIGNELFTLLGPAFVKSVIASGFKVFLDLKFHDIPNTVVQACKLAADMGVWMLNVHASGGYQMMAQARKALDSYDSARPLLVAVTVLTSMSANEMHDLGVHQPLIQHVCSLAKLAQSANLDGVVCSAQEASYIKEACGKDFITVTPGIRLTNEKTDDQTRITLPSQAIKQGSDLLVIGRPITRALKPAEVLHSILSSLDDEIN